MQYLRLLHLSDSSTRLVFYILRVTHSATVCRLHQIEVTIPTFSDMCRQKQRYLFCYARRQHTMASHRSFRTMPKTVLLNRLRGFSVFAWQHQCPVLIRPASVKLDLAQQEFCVSNFLSCMFMAIAIFIDHQSCQRHQGSHCPLHWPQTRGC